MLHVLSKIISYAKDIGRLKLDYINKMSWKLSNRTQPKTFEP